MNRTSLKTGITIIVLMLFIFGTELNAIAKPPSWAPAHGYKAKTRYIYFPQQNVYYDLKTDRYIYPNNNVWIFGSALPSIFGPVNLVSARQIELDYYNSKPYLYNKKHVVIYDSPAKIKVEKVKSENEYHHSKGNGSEKGKSKGSKK